jgi:3-oxoacyl-[acyl-carrier protein] reductase
VTGAGQEIGRVVATVVVAMGGRATAVDLNADALASLLVELGADRCCTVVGSVADPDTASRAVQDTVAAFGRVDGLVNSATSLVQE